METDIYNKIREDHTKRFGTDVQIYGKVLLANLYSDRTHFIYEILQNAEDAYARAKQEGLENNSDIEFRLFTDRLEVKHKGIPFNYKDIVSICRIAYGTKYDDSSQIGKFGIGFKSVYAFTKSPEIYSGENSFCVKHYVHPYKISRREDIGVEETLFNIPFNHEDVTPSDAYLDIKRRLKKLGLTTLLFLRITSRINWLIFFPESKGKISGRYSRDSKKVGSATRITLRYDDRVNEEKIENWLVFKKKFTNFDNTKNGQTIEIAYRLNENCREIIPAPETHLCVYFPTEKETYLKFLIQGPYNTTPARDNIRQDKWNKNLIENTAQFVAESITKVKEVDLLNISFLNTLPIESEYLEKQNQIFNPIYEKVKETLSSDNPLLPTSDGDYTTPARGFIARGEKLQDLLSQEQLSLLFGKNDTKWLDKNITRTPKLREYLMEELEDEEVDPEKFGRNINEQFIKQQSDEWIKRFYTFLSERKALWRRKENTWEDEGVLLSKPIIRLENDKHILPFNSNGKPLAYLPILGKLNTNFPTVKRNIADDPKARKFLEELGLKEPDPTTEVIELILPRYQTEYASIHSKENIQHVKIISEVLQKTSSQEQKDYLLKELKDTPFLYTKNIANSEISYKTPSEIYLGEAYTENSGIDTFFKENESIWLLDKRYRDIDVKLLIEMGCKSEIQVLFDEPEWDGNVIVIDKHGNHMRGLDGFDPNCEIEGLEYAVEHIDIEKASIIWGILKKHYKRIGGAVEISSYKDFRNPETKYWWSKMGEVLSGNAWIPDRKKQKFHKPSKISLLELPEEYDIESLESKQIAEQLEFKTEIKSQLIEQLPERERKLFDMVEKLSQNMPIEEAYKAIDNLIEKAQKKKEEITIQDAATKFKDSLITEGSIESDYANDKRYTGISPHEEEQLRETYGKNFPDIVDSIITATNLKIVNEFNIGGNIDPKEFLYDQYAGHCQICNERLDLGTNRRPHFNIYRFFEKRGKNQYADLEFNILCLCPNCHALLKHGSKDLSNISETIEKVLNGEIAPESVEERNGDFYIVKIEVVGKEKELFYTPRHMNKLAVFFKQA